MHKAPFFYAAGFIVGIFTETLMDIGHPVAGFVASAGLGAIAAFIDIRSKRGAV